MNQSEHANRNALSEVENYIYIYITAYIYIYNITTNVNISLETSSVPLCLKKAVVTPLLKKLQLDHDIISNFRPVSNLSFTSQGY